MATIATLRQLVIDNTRDPNYRVRPQATVDRAINSAYDTIQQELEGFIDATQSTTTITTVAGQQEYTLPSDFNITQTVQYGNRALYYLTKNLIIDANQNTTAGSPSYYYTRGNKFWLYPIPNEVATVSVNYTALLPTITDSVESDNPAVLDVAIAYKATVLLFKQVQKIQEAQVWEQEYQSEINNARLSLRKDDNITYHLEPRTVPTSDRTYDYYN